MKSFFKISFIVFSFLALFYSNTFAFIEFKQSKDISSDTEQARGINFKPDGTIMYITNRKLLGTSANQDGQVTQYFLSTPFDISTAKKTSQIDLLGGGSTPILKYPHAIEFKPDGTKMFIVSGDQFSDIYQYRLTTAWDSSTAEFETIHAVSRDNNTKHLRTLAFKPDGSRMFTGGKGDSGTSQIKEFILANPWDLTSGVSAGDVSANLKTTSDTNFRNTQFDTTGSIMYIMGNTNNNIHKYTLSTPWDVTTISSASTEYDTGSRFSNMRGFIFAARFTKLFVTDDNGSTNTIFEYSAACAVTITCSDLSNLSLIHI